jgi:glycine/sarcosine N-methyltransferase
MEYDSFSSDYDRFVNWSSRLNYELPFIEKQLQNIAIRNGKPVRVLDSACGTGMHTIELAKRGYSLSGTDLSVGMIRQAQSNAESAHVNVSFTVAALGSQAAALRDSVNFPFDVILCLGNSLPHMLTPRDLSAALDDFYAILRPGGLLLVQNRNFDAVISARERWMDPQSAQHGNTEWIFLRFYDFQPDGLIAFNIVTLRRDAGKNWQQQVTLTHLRPILQTEFTQLLEKAGFEEITIYGDLTGTAFDPGTSGNLVVIARRKG